MRVSTTLATLLAASALAAAPPTVTLPPEISGGVSAFVTIRAKVEGEAKGVKYVPVDPGLSVFPSDLLADKTVTVVVAANAGRYRVLAYSGNADGPSEPALTTVVIGGATTPPPVKPPPADPPITPTDIYYFAVIRPDQNTKEFEALMNLPAWTEWKAKGHTVLDIPLRELPTGVTSPAMLPAVVILRQNADGRTWTDTKRPKPMPTTDTQIRELLK